MPTLFYLLPVTFLALGAGLFVFGQIQQRKAKVVESWPKTPGVIFTSDMDQHYSTDNEGMTSYTYEPVIEYTYKFMGVEYSGSQYRMGSKGTSFDRRKAESILSRYPVGQQVEVYYNPDNPAQAVLEHGSASGPLLLIVGAVFAVVGVVLLFAFILA
jgi:hypothetical protein